MSQYDWKKHSKVYRKVYRPLQIEGDKELSGSYSDAIKDFKFSHDDSLIAFVVAPDYWNNKLCLMSIDGTTLYYGGAQYEYDVWDGRNRESPHMKEVQVRISKIQWSADSQLLWCATDNGLYEFSIKKKQFRRLFTEIEETEVLSFTDITVNPREKVVALLGYENKDVEQGSIYLIAMNGALLKKIGNKHPFPSDYNDRISYSSDCTKLFTYGDDKILRVWNVASEELLDEVELGVDRPNIFFPIPSKNQLIAAYLLITYDENGKITETQDIDEIITGEKRDPSYKITITEVLEDGEHLVTSEGVIYDLQGREVGVIGKYAKVYRANTQDMVAGLETRSIDLYMGKESKEQYTLLHEEPLGSSAHAAAISHDNKMMAIFGYYSKLVYIGSLDGEPMYEGELNEVYQKFYWNLIPQKQEKIRVNQAAWSPDDKSLWCATDDGFYSFSVEDQEFSRIYQCTELLCLAVNYQQNYVALAGYYGTESEKIILMFDFEGNLLRQITSKNTAGYITHLLFSHDFTKLIVCCSGKYLRVFDEATWEQLDFMDLAYGADYLYLGNEDHQFVLRDGYYQSWYALLLDKEGKIDDLTQIQPPQVGCYMPEEMYNFVKDNRRTGKLGVFHVVSPNKKLVAELQSNPMGSGIDHPIKFYSYRPKEAFFESTEVGAGWREDKHFPDITRVGVLTRLEKFPNKWLALKWNELVLYDETFNQEEVYDFKRAQDSASTSYILNPCDFNEKTQRLIIYVHYASMRFKELQLIDFNAIDDFSVLRKKRYTYRPVTDADFIGDPVMLKWSPDGTQFAAINRDNLIIYNDQLEEIFRETFDLRHGPRNIEWSPSGDKIAVGFYQGIVYIYDVVKRSVERKLPTVDIEDINQMVWLSETGELIIPSNRYINIFNSEGYIIRKLDFKEKTAFDKTACHPGTNEFAVAFPTSEGDHLYIIDRNKGIRECVIQEIPLVNDTVNLLKYETSDLLITQSKTGIKFWRTIAENG